MAVKRIPDGFHRVTPHLVVRDAATMIEFYKKAFGAVERGRAPGPDGKSIMHAEIRIGDSHVMLSDEHPEQGHLSPTSRGGATGSLMLYLPDVDAVFARAIAAGATAQSEPADQFWGDRMGSVRDPFGHLWSLATHTEDVPPEEMERRMAEAFQQPA